jgi:2-polyprenyl-6-methoxyphenol hydroxylase-like FAD-dependent oxidoreductase
VRILVSGASIAGPVLAHWLSRYGFAVTVVERSPTLRKTGGHAVDLFRPAVEISEKMGVLPRIEERATGTNRLIVTREGATGSVDIDLTKLYGAASDRHVEIMRDDLSEIYYGAARDEVEYVFGDRITAISPDGTVAFDHEVEPAGCTRVSAGSSSAPRRATPTSRAPTWPSSRCRRSSAGTG